MDFKISVSKIAFENILIIQLRQETHSKGLGRIFAAIFNCIKMGFNLMFLVQIEIVNFV